MSKQDMLQQGTRLVESSETVSAFWISTYPFFETTLYVLPCGESRGEVAQTFLTFFDPDGGVINKVKLQLPVGEIKKVDLNMLLGSCKIESGLRHAVMLVRSPLGTKHLCRISNGRNSSVCGELQIFSDERTAFLPLSFSEKMTSLIPIVNFSENEVKVRCGLFFGEKNHKLEVTIPAQGTRLISVDAELFEVLELGDDEKKMAYLRVSTRSVGQLGLQMLECLSIKESDEYTMIC
ncbi:MAG: hypothetical protein ACOX2O_05625 [Bdellovibrionota bacterium]|jgi:hypothetical protein